MSSEEPRFRSLTREERRDRIVWAAKHVFIEYGLDASSMDDVAARAGTTKPTVYAHFKSKDELFSAVIELIRGLFLGKLRSPDVYADEPIEAITLFCGRLLELVSWRDSIVYQRVTLATATRSPEIARAVYDAGYAEASRSLAAYLRARKLSRDPETHAEVILAATVAGSMLRHLYGVDEPNTEPPDEQTVGTRIDLKRIRQIVELVASQWEV